MSAIRWTRDGKISFLAKRGRDEHRSLSVIAADGGEARRVLAHGADIEGYSWSPDGARGRGRRRAVYNSLTRATTVTGNGRTLEAIPIDRLRAILGERKR